MKNLRIKNYKLFDPINKIKLLKLKGILKLKSPNFLLDNKIYEEYNKKTKKFFFNAFYMWGKKN